MANKEVVSYITDQDIQDLANRFKYHPPTDGQAERYQDLRDQGYNLALLISRRCPPSRERSLAITNLEQALFWANAAIARNETPTKLTE